MNVLLAMAKCTLELDPTQNPHCHFHRNGAAAVENGLAVTQRVKQGMTTGPSHFSPRHVSPKMESRDSKR